ncbi:tRNA1(Val) (adenine(37)-N6)-methyltransferase [Ciceribacter sp. L1K23]|uniref:tRNA1(Val) (adenine(37)-N6)-methyltransferase n=1 Tax=Ciceribacter sp. L1K23 TaxID=2820276 RepID=UPI001B82A91B|nr:tRNA1(Val) (adenine(37)-N6)-methyltransferase [Ciceribacter sp. L1K23]MBR0556778.1 tRNA1(Val) (adenine(37)-N6)-methyltransferase [Ciceribacter sp. L1K23]
MVVPAPAIAETVDAFHRGRFYLVQPSGRGHRAGMDAMLLASLVDASGPIRVADLGAGAGAAGLAVVSRLSSASAVLFERSPEMAEFARKSLVLPENAGLADRASVIEADVTLTGKARNDAGLVDDSFHHVIMNPPFNDAADRAAPDRLRAEAHAMTGDLFESWIRTAGAIMIPGGQLSLIARPQSIAEILGACARRFGGIEITPLHPRPGENAVRILLTAIKGSRARLQLRPPLVMHDDPSSHSFSAFVDDLNNGRAAYPRKS